jgi:molybdopterin converting factor subunit 1
MNVRVRLFARARDLAGRQAVFLELPAEATVGEVRRRLAVEYPALEAILGRCALAVNDEFAEDTAALPANAEVALLPPVSGG